MSWNIFFLYSTHIAALVNWLMAPASCMSLVMFLVWSLSVSISSSIKWDADSIYPTQLWVLIYKLLFLLSVMVHSLRDRNILTLYIQRCYIIIGNNNKKFVITDIYIPTFLPIYTDIWKQLFFTFAIIISGNMSSSALILLMFPKDVSFTL